MAQKSTSFAMKACPTRALSSAAPTLAPIARGFGIGGVRVDDLSALPGMVAEFARTGGAAVWDFPVSDRVASARNPPRPPKGPQRNGASCRHDWATGCGHTLAPWHRQAEGSGLGRWIATHRPTADLVFEVIRSTLSPCDNK